MLLYIYIVLSGNTRVLAIVFLWYHYAEQSPLFGMVIYLMVVVSGMLWFYNNKYSVYALVLAKI